MDKYEKRPAPSLSGPRVSSTARIRRTAGAITSNICATTSTWTRGQWAH